MAAEVQPPLGVDAQTTHITFAKVATNILFDNDEQNDLNERFKTSRNLTPP